MSEISTMAKDVLKQIADGAEHEVGRHYWNSAISLCRRGLAVTRSDGKGFFATITDAGRNALATF